MIRIIFAFMVMFLPTAAYAADEVYRGFVWGVGQADVRKFERAVFYRAEENSLYFIDNKTKDHVIIRYDFNANRLWRIEAEYMNLHKPDVRDVTDLVTAEQNKLSRRFGKPDEDLLIWKNRKYRGHPQFYPRAYGMGDLQFRSVWNDADSLVTFQSFYDGMYYRLGYILQDQKTVQRNEPIKTFNFNLQPQ